MLFFSTFIALYLSPILSFLLMFLMLDKSKFTPLSRILIAIAFALLVWSFLSYWLISKSISLNKKREQISSADLFPFSP